jgi:hypothetical protein
MGEIADAQDQSKSNASQERIAAARIQGSRAAAKERAAALPPPGAKKPFPPG